MGYDNSGNGGEIRVKATLGQTITRVVGGSDIELDYTLTKDGYASNSRTVGIELAKKANITDVETALDEKADKETTLAGYGITDAYTKSEVDEMMVEHVSGVSSVNGMTGDVTITASGLGALTEHQDISGKADKSTTLSGYGITNAYTKTEVDSKISQVPTVTKVSQLQNDVGYLTQHQDISGKADKSEIPVIPTNVSAFTNDSGYLTSEGAYTKAQIDTALQGKASTADLSALQTVVNGKADVGSIPTKVSDLQNDAGYLTQHQSLADYALKSELPTVPTNVSSFTNDAGYLTAHQDLSDYALKTDIPTVPTKVSDLTNDAGYLTSHQDISGKADKSEIPTKTSDLTNDSGFLTSHQDISGKQDKSNLVTSMTAQSTDTQYPSAKCVYDAISNIPGGGGGSGDGDVLKRLLFDSATDDPTKTQVAVTITTTGETAEGQVENVGKNSTVLYGTGSPGNIGVGRCGLNNSGYLRYGANGVSYCLPVTAGHTYAFVQETARSNDGYSTLQQTTFSPGFDFEFNRSYADIPNTYGAINYAAASHTVKGTGKIFNSADRDMVVVPDGMAYMIVSINNSSNIYDADQADTVRKFKVYDYTLNPVDATYEQIVDDPVITDSYTITYNLTGATSSNDASSVAGGNTYQTTISADSGKLLDACSVTVGSASYTPVNGAISIEDANGNIVINATGAVPSGSGYVGVYTVKEGLIPTGPFDDKIDKPTGFDDASAGKLLYTDGNGSLTISVPDGMAKVIEHDLVYVPVYCEWVAPKYYDTSGNCVTATTEQMWSSDLKNVAICTDPENKIKCTQGERWRFKVPRLRVDALSAFMPSILVFDGEGGLVTSVTDPTHEDDGWYYMTMPEGAEYLAINGQSPMSQSNFMQRLSIPVHRKTDVLDFVRASYNAMRRLPAPTLNTLTKGYICIGTDDLRVSETGALHDMFTAENIPYYISAIPESLKFNIPYGDGRTTNLAICRMCVEDGGEILVHNNEPITADNIDNYDKLYDYFVRTKEELEAYGFDVRGLILAGGTGAIQTDPRADRFASAFYEFTDRFGSTYPFGGTDRTGLQYATTAELDQLVTDVCVNHKYKFVMTHTAETTAVENFEYLMEKLGDYTRGTDYEFVTPSQLYDILMG